MKSGRIVVGKRIPTSVMPTACYTIRRLRLVMNLYLFSVSHYCLSDAHDTTRSIRTCCSPNLHVMLNQSSRFRLLNKIGSC